MSRRLDRSRGKELVRGHWRFVDIGTASSAPRLEVLFADAGTGKTTAPKRPAHEFVCSAASRNRQGQLRIQFPHPDIPEANWLAGVRVCLQLDWRGVELPVERLPNIQRLALHVSS